MKKFNFFTIAFLLLPTWAYPSLCRERPRQTFLGTLQAAELSETSGLRVSPTNPQLLYHFSDSGQSLFVTDLYGKTLKSVPLKVKLYDVEALTFSRCQNEICLVVGDIGDNDKVRSSIQLHFFKESRLLASRGALTPDFTVDLKYPSQYGPQNAEALWTDPQGQIYLFTKVKGSPISQLFRVEIKNSSLQWIRSMDLSTFVPSDANPANKKNWLMISDADFNYQDQSLAVITYRYVFEFKWGSLNKKEFRMRPKEDYVVRTLDKPSQYEGISYLPSSQTLLISSEMEARSPRAPLWSLECASTL